MHQRKYHIGWIIFSLFVVETYSCTAKKKSPSLSIKRGETIRIERDKTVQWCVISLRNNMTLHQLSGLTGKSEKELIKWNPELKDKTPYKDQGIGLYLTHREEKQLSINTDMCRIRDKAHPNVKEVIRYRVKGHETMDSLVRKFHSNASMLEQMNDPSKLAVMEPGTILNIPVLWQIKHDSHLNNNIKTYKIRHGDTAFNIARKRHTNLKKLRELNPNINLSRIRSGMIIYIPLSGKRTKKHTD